MPAKSVPHRFVLIALILLLVACGTLSPKQVASTPIISVTDVNNTALSAAFTEVAQTRAAMPTSTVIPTNTLLPSTPTQTRLPFMALDGLRVVYTNSNGNLYLYDSGKPAIQLTQGVKESMENRPPLISDDGQNIIFYRAGEANLDSVYTINADRTDEQVLVNSALLSVFGKEYDEFTTLFSLAFVPGTHLLLFNTYQQSNFDPESAGWLPIVGNDLFIVNTDNGEIKQLKAPWQGGNFLAAPNGKWIAVQTLDHIDVIDVQGQNIRRNLETYTKSEGHVLVPMYWTTDSRELIILPSGIPLFAGVTVVRTVWRYPMSGGPGIEIKLDPSPVWDAYTVSPDGNWIAYSYVPEVAGASPSATAGVYLGNLHDGTSQLIYMPQPDQRTGRLDIPYSYHDWSPDSVNFVFHNSSGRISMGNVRGEIAPLGRGEGILGWIDSTHYVLSNGVVGDVENIIVPDAYIYYDPIAFVFLKH
jgi:WD40-like Beta Propeller Repeat